MEKKKQFFLTLNKQVPMTSKDTFLLYEKLFSNKKIDLILSDQCDIHDSLASLRVQLKAKETPGLGCGLQVCIRCVLYFRTI